MQEQRGENNLGRPVLEGPGTDLADILINTYCPPRLVPLRQCDTNTTLLAYHVGVENGGNVDRPRNLASPSQWFRSPNWVPILVSPSYNGLNVG